MAGNGAMVAVMERDERIGLFQCNRGQLQHIRENDQRCAGLV